MPLDILLEGWLFYRARPVKKIEILKELKISEDDLTVATEKLRSRLIDGALRLTETSDELQLVTAPNLSEFIETLQKITLKKDIGKAGAETLAIILYKGEVTRAEVDHIRGVNSAFTIRDLQTRGLIEHKLTRPNGEYVFTITSELLNMLGVEKRHDLTNFSSIMSKLDDFTIQTEEN